MKPLLVLLFAAALAFSQERDSKLGVLSGTVLADGKGIAGATVGLSVEFVTLLSTEPRATSLGKSTVTGLDGKFTLDGVIPGTYRLVALAPGFLRQSYGAKPGSNAGTPLFVDAAASLEGIDIQLTRQSAITGSVITSGGESAPNIPVHAVSITYTNGIRRLREHGQRGVTDSRGAFRMFGLSPGTYFVYADPPSLTSGSERDALPTYAPSALRLSEAVPVHITAGSDGVANVRLRGDRPITIRGKVVAPGDRPPEGANVLLMRDADTPTLPATTATTAEARARDLLAAAANPRLPYAAAATTTSDGSFALSGVVPGRHRLVAFGGKRLMLNASSDLATTSFWQRTNETPTLDDASVGYLDVVAGSEDVNGIEIRLSPGSRVSTRVTGGDSPPPAVLVPADGLSYGGAPSNRQTDVREDGTQPVSPGRYFIKINGSNAQFYVKSMSLNNVEITAKRVDVSGGMAKLEIELARDGGTLTGSVADSDGASRPGASVGLWPVTADLSRMDGGAFATVSSNTGSFKIQMVPPGEYYLAAFEDLPDPGLAQYGPFLDQFTAKAKRVKVDANGSASVSLKAISADDAQRVFATLR